MAVKRGKGQRLIPLEETRECERIDVERSDRLTADQVYERHWAFTVLEQVMARLREEYRSAGNLRFFDQMKKMLLDEPDRPSQAQVASETPQNGSKALLACVGFGRSPKPLRNQRAGIVIY